MSEQPLSVADVAAGLQLHRSIAYRMLRTLEDHQLLERDGEHRYLAGPALTALARRVAPTLRAAAGSQLSALADDLGMTAFLVIREGDEAVTVAVVEPRQSSVHVVYRPGTRHPVDRGAPGLALLAGSPPVPDERAEVSEARARGWAYSHSEVLPGMRSVASPVVDGSGACHGALAVVFVADVELDALGARVAAAAQSVGEELTDAGV